MSEIVSALLARAQRTTMAQVTEQDPRATTEEWEAFRAALAETRLDDAGPLCLTGHALYGTQGEPGTMARLVSVYAPAGEGKGLWPLWREWVGARRLHIEREAAAAAKAALDATTIEVESWRGAGKGWGKPVRVAKDAPWAKPGEVVLTQKLDLIGRGYDSDIGATFRVRSTEVGAALPEGTVRAKRIVRVGRDDGLALGIDVALLPETGRARLIQYAVKPRNKAGQARYERECRIAEIERDLRIYADEHSAERRQSLQAELMRLRSEGT